MPKSKEKAAQVIPIRVPTGLVNSFGYGWFKNRDVMTIEFEYTPPNGSAETIARIHLTRDAAEGIRKAIDEFLSKGQAKKTTAKELA